MNIRNSIVILFLILTPSTWAQEPGQDLTPTAWGQTQMSDVIKTMPDTLLPYLDASKRTELIDFYKMGVEAKTTNKFSGATVLDTLSAHYAQLQLSESSTMQLLLLPQEDADTLICAVRTYLGEAPESTVSFYATDWRPLDASLYLPPLSPMALVERPDTMSVEQYDAVLKTLDPAMLEARLAPDSTLTFTVTAPLLNEAERKALEAVALQRKLKWNGKNFN